MATSRHVKLSWDLEILFTLIVVTVCKEWWSNNGGGSPRNDASGIQLLYWATLFHKIISIEKLATLIWWHIIYVPTLNRRNNVVGTAPSDCKTINVGWWCIMWATLNQNVQCSAVTYLPITRMKNNSIRTSQNKPTAIWYGVCDSDWLYFKGPSIKARTHGEGA